MKHFYDPIMFPILRLDEFVPWWLNLCSYGAWKQTSQRLKSVFGSLFSWILCQASPSDINYASLDLKAVQKRKKKSKYPEKQTHQVQTHRDSLDVEAECDLDLPSRTCSLMVSRSSIYLNSHQVALEAEELERERERDQERERNFGLEMDITHQQIGYDYDQSHSVSSGARYLENQEHN